MSSKFNEIKNYFLFVSITIILSILLLLVPLYNLKNNKNYMVEANKNINNEKIEAVINEVPDNMEIVSKYVIDDLYTNVLLHSKISEETMIYESHIYNNENGLEVDIDTLLKKGKTEEFWAKVYGLLALKYPMFIVNGIKSSEGNNAYDIKENEMIIYFMNYTIEPAVQELITLRVNYNEVKDFIDFTCKLDDIYANEDGYKYNSNKKTVALTYDDGPKGEKTEKILNILAENKARATFFMVGSMMEADKNTVLKAHESGNEIGSHTYAHANLTRQTEEERNVDLVKTNEIYKSITGDEIKLLRPPYGAYKKDMLEELDYSVILWNIDTEDWRYRDVDRIVNTVLDNLSDGSVILMHDSYNTTIEATKKLLPILYSKGYQVVSVSELANLKGIELEENNAYRKFK